MSFVQDSTGALTGAVDVGGTACLTTGTVTGTVRLRGISLGAVPGENDVNFTATLMDGDTLSGTYRATVGYWGGDEGVVQISCATQPV